MLQRGLDYAAATVIISALETDAGYGPDLIYRERPSGGRVFNAGSTNYAGGRSRWTPG